MAAMQKAALVLAVTCYKAAMNACEKTEHRKQARGLLAAMQKADLAFEVSEVMHQKHQGSIGMLLTFKVPRHSGFIRELVGKMDL